ncbi:MAG: DHH family phosphoesterase [Candidatus Thermoplasmatota archaeon]
MVVVITHSDPDGVLSLATLLQYLGKAQKIRAYFTSPARLLDIICISVMSKEKILDNLYVLDFSGKRETITASAIYENAFWYDHHIWDLSDADLKFENVKIFVDSGALSTVGVLAKFLNCTNEFEKYANEIDTNSVVSEEAERIRDLVSAYRNKFSGIMLSSVLFALAKRLAESVDEIFNPVYDNIILNYKKWLSEAEKEIYAALKVYTKRNMKIGIVSLKEYLPIFHIFNLLGHHSEAPFDILVVTVLDKLNTYTKLEFRTYTDKDVLALARFFDGGGHRIASGASVKGRVTSEDILRAIKMLKL